MTTDGFTGRFNSCGIVQSMVGEIPAYINEALSMQVLTTTPILSSPHRSARSQLTSMRRSTGSSDQRRPTPI